MTNKLSLVDLNRNFDTLNARLLGGHLIKDMMNRVFDDAGYVMGTEGFPPYNIVKKSENEFEIEMAVAGFNPEDISITTDNGYLLIEGKNSTENTDVEKTFLYRGIAARSFKQQFPLADFIEVGQANMKDGILRVSLNKNIPEHLKPKKIEIESQ